MTTIVDFADSLAKGSIGEQIFVEDFLRFNGIEYEDVTGQQAFRLVDTDLMIPYGSVEVKANYRDDGHFIFEEYNNCNPRLGRITRGWFYYSTADLFVSVSTKTRTMILVPNTEELHAWYEENKHYYELRRNKISRKDGRLWQSAYRRVPLVDMENLYAVYRRGGFPVTPGHEFMQATQMKLLS